MIPDFRLAALRGAAANGCRAAALDVDSDDVTGALRVYERPGFETARTNVAWSVAQPPVASR
ncbi:hypothetical protein ABC795_04345 [Blastococcus sp. HT6-30]|uniref:hypothetical protein n=1 Tax=Blastococcus sp. HT6-30 TaxID=3144843 RepID=UPI0032192136